MFGKRKDKINKSNVDIRNENYVMKDNYDSSSLVIANLEYVDADYEEPLVETTEQKYLFEILNDTGKIRYREIFTGFVADIEERNYFYFPYVVNIMPLREYMPSVVDNISKYGLLFVMNEINTKNDVKKLKK